MQSVLVIGCDQTSQGHKSVGSAPSLSVKVLSGARTGPDAGRHDAQLRALILQA
jgi:predicted component of type VI protein secretion system